MATKYVLEVNVTGADSGSDRLARQQGEVIPSDTEQIRQPERQRQQASIEDRVLGERFNTLKKVGLVGVSGGFVALDLFQQDLSFKGDSNRNNKINETKKIAGIASVATGLVLSGNILGAGMFLGYQAIAYAKENRELINARKVDTYKSQYYAARLVQDTTQRSR
jgi:hypothetical protein